MLHLKLNSRLKLSLIGAALLLVGLFSAVLVSQKAQENRSRADTAPSDALISYKYIIGGYNIYAPEIIYDKEEHIYKMWFGGWMSQSDVPYDRMYYSTSYDRVSWSAPLEVLVAAPTQINDPSVIKLSPGHYVMIFTSLSYSAEGWITDPDCVNTHRSMNLVFKSISSDGIHWSTPSELIGRNNGYSLCGAWAPSVVLRDNAYWVYYGDEKWTYILLSKFDMNFNLLSTQRITTDNKVRANPHVVADHGTWYMFYNAAVNGFDRFEMVASVDGVHWDQDHPKLIMSIAGDSTHSVLTPFVLFSETEPQLYWLYFGYGDQTNQASTIHVWQYKRQCLDVACTTFAGWPQPVANPTGAPLPSPILASLNGIPIAGDWDGDGKDTIGLFVNNKFYLRNSNTSGAADLVLDYGTGDPSQRPVAGDWDGDGKDTIGLFLAGKFYLRNTNTSGAADLVLNYATGNPSDVPVVGDWDGDRKSTLGLFTNTKFYLRNSNTSGAADVVFSYTAASLLPTIQPTGISTPTSIPTSAPTSLPTSTAIPTRIPTPTSLPTSAPTMAPSATGIPRGIVANLDLILKGVAASPLHPVRSVSVDVYNTQNALVASKSTQVHFVSAIGNFTGSVDLGAIPSGVYIIKIKSDQYLRSQLSGIQSLLSGSTNILPQVSLNAGDINGDNKINIADYSMLVGCYSDLLAASSCTPANKLLSDLTDDGQVNQFDYNLFLRGLFSRGGE